MTRLMLSTALCITLPYALKLADLGWKEALMADPNLRNGLNVCHGEITYESVAQALDLPFNPQPAKLAA